MSEHALYERIARIEALLAAQDPLWLARAARLDERWGNQEKNLVLANKQLEERLALLNELRSDVLTRTEHDAIHRAVDERFAALEKDTREYIVRDDYESRHADLERRVGRIETAVVALPAREEQAQRNQENDRRMVALETHVMPREDIIASLSTVNRRFVDLETWKANLAGRMVVFAGGGAMIIGVVSALIGYGITKVFGI